MTSIDRDLFNYLSEFLTDNRKKRIEEVLDYRTRRLTVVLENTYHPPNASAVIRTCECFGLQDIHIIQNERCFKVNKTVVYGASKWVSLHLYTQMADASERCLSNLKKSGYKIVVTTLREENVLDISEIPLSEKLAICFGTEERGMSDIGHQMADYQIKLPMHGFTQSYNISVSAALCLSSLVPRLHKSEIPWRISGQEKEILRFEWYKKSIKNVDQICERYYQSVKTK